MFFSVASPDWKPGQPLAPAGALLFRTRAEAALFAPDAAVVGVSVRYDAAMQTVWPQGNGAATAGPWSAQAVSNRLGGITVFGTIPAALVRPLGSDQCPAASTSLPAAEVVPTEFHGWDSLTMALLA